jgi:hypothetical protein
MEAKCSSGTSIHFNRLHGLIWQKTEFFNTLHSHRYEKCSSEISVDFQRPTLDSRGNWTEKKISRDSSVGIATGYGVIDYWLYISDKDSVTPNLIRSFVLCIVERKRVAQSPWRAEDQNVGISVADLQFLYGFVLTYNNNFCYETNIIFNLYNYNGIKIIQDIMYSWSTVSCSQNETYTQSLRLQCHLQIVFLDPLTIML